MKEEIRRLARKEIKAETSKTQRAVVQYRRDLAMLKRAIQAQQKEIARLKTGKQQASAQTKEDALEGVRFSARSVKAQRQRLKLSAADYGKLVGVSGLTVYNWESGKARPRKPQLAALVAVRGIGKQEAKTKLEAIAAEKGK